jgi:hypothetical protein
MMQSKFKNIDISLETLEKKSEANQQMIETLALTQSRVII